MRLFDCKVRLAGSLTNEVRKFGVTAAEITVLRVLHTQDSLKDDPISEIKVVKGKSAMMPDPNDDTKEVKRTDKFERARLDALYGDALKSIDGVKNLNGVFGVATPLPDSVPGIEGEVVADETVKRVEKTKPDPLAELE